MVAAARYILDRPQAERDLLRSGAGPGIPTIGDDNPGGRASRLSFSPAWPTLRGVRLALFSLCLLAGSALAKPAAPRDPARVSVLGYHDFSGTAAETEMLIRTSKFREQMKAIKESGLPVISMADFQAWKRGEKEIPAQSLVITIDDGWKSVYTDAFPVLREFGYPFTLYLYKNYVEGGGKALTIAMIREMMEHGASIGSHSVSHPYPAEVKRQLKAGPEAYDRFLNVQMGESKQFLEETFSRTVTSYAYPGGFHTPEMFPLADRLGYSHLFTVIPGKIQRDTPDATLPRYVVLGTFDRIFEQAVNFNLGYNLCHAPPRTRPFRSLLASFHVISSPLLPLPSSNFFPNREEVLHHAPSFLPPKPRWQGPPARAWVQQPVHRGPTKSLGSSERPCRSVGPEARPTCWGPLP